MHQQEFNQLVVDQAKQSMDVNIPSFDHENQDVRAAINCGANKRKLRRNCRNAIKAITGNLEVAPKYCKLHGEWFWINKNPLLQLFIRNLLEGSSEDETIYAFSSQEMLKIFVETTEHGIDPTYSIESGGPFKQCVVIVSQMTKNYEKISVPIIFFKVKDKTAKTYSRCLKVLKALCPRLVFFTM